MKKIICILLAALAALLLFACAFAEEAQPAYEGEPTIQQAAEEAATVEAPAETHEEQAPFTWAYLATIAGATAATLLIVQFLKLPLDNAAFGKIPTRLVAYVIALVIMLVATAFTNGLTAENALLAVVNAFVVALAAMGSYEVTFAKIGK